MLWYANAEGHLAYVNGAWQTFRGRSLEQERAFGWLEGVMEHDRTRVRETLIDACREGRPFAVECRVRRADDTVRTVAINGSPWTGDRETAIGQVGSCVDITDRRAATPAPESGSTLQRLEELIASARDMAYRLRLVPTQGFDYVVGAVEAITGHTPQQFYDDPSLSQRALHPEDRAIALAHTDADQLANPDVVVRWVHPSGAIVWAEHRRRPVFDASGHIIAIEGIARDVTQQVEIQQRLRESEEQMRQLAGRLQTAREEERAHVARELHDELGQTLTALKLEIGRTNAALKVHRLAPVVVDRMQSLMGLSEIGLATVKRIATDLRPPALDHLGLAEAIEWEALAFKARSGLRCHVRANKGTTRLTREQQTAVFRIFQEALTNVARHAGASAITVTLTERDHFDLRIKDNGKGITDTQAADPRAIGLIGMRERVALIGGTFHIAGHRGKGTTISVHVPLAAADNPRRTGTLRRSSSRKRHADDSNSAR